MGGESVGLELPASWLSGVFYIKIKFYETHMGYMPMCCNYLAA